MKRATRTKRSPLVRLLTLAAAVGVSALQPHDVRADLCASVSPVFTGDPCDPATGPYPMLPGLPLVLPAKGPTGRWPDGPPQITTAVTGDVDLAVRVGSFPVATEIPAPAGSVDNPTLTPIVAGGGGSSQGSPVSFTTFVTDGPGTFPYGAPLAGLQERPVAVFAYADLDGDGYIGPTESDGSGDDEIERQEAIAHVGRQVGQIDVDRFRNVVAVRVGAPASIGGLRVSLVAGMYTGDDPGLLWTNGTPIFTNWPFFPPLDPLAVVFLDEANPPDSNGPNILFYQPSEFLLPGPATVDLKEAFAVRADGSNPSTDQFLSVSGPAVGVRIFRDIDPGNFSASSRLVARPAPEATGPGRTLVTPAGEVAIKIGENVRFRLLPVDSLGNIADPDPPGIAVKLVSDGGLRILSPSTDADPLSETITVDSAKGVFVELDTTNVAGREGLTLYGAPPAEPTGMDQALVFASSSGDVDADDDGVSDDGDGSGTIGDRPCSASDMLGAVPCDDNCPNVVNPSQNDSDGDGQGNCCDGACVLNDGDAGCIECPQARSRFQAFIVHARSVIRPRGGEAIDRVRVRTLLRLEEGQVLAPDAEEVEFTIAEGGRLHYFAQLPGVFLKADKAPTYMYDDPTGALGGVYKAQLRRTKRGMRARFQARGLNLVETVAGEPLPGGLVLAITIGDDTFTRHLKCASSSSLVRCVSTDIPAK